MSNSMSIISEERSSDSPYVEAITRGQTASDGATIRPAEIHWHMVFARHNGNLYPFMVGPWTTSGVVTFTEGAQILWIKFKLGTCIPHLPARNLVDRETRLPEAASDSFWLNGSAWQFPGYENVETFVDRLVHEDILIYDPAVSAALQGRSPEMSARTLRHRFLQATGLSQNHIRQSKRANRAAVRLKQGVPIIDTAYQLGYFDQAHMTRAMKRFIGYTPAQIARVSQSG